MMTDEQQDNQTTATKIHDFVVSLQQQSKTISSTNSSDVPSSVCSYGSVIPLHGYQQEGVAWMLNMYARKTNCILADDMGMGKTLQLLCLFASVDSSGPFLVICPLSVVSQWCEQAAKFCPTLKVVEYTANGNNSRETCRHEITEFILKQPSSRHNDPLLPFNVLVSTYEIVLADISFIGKFQWRIVAVDEAHRVKNVNGKLRAILSNEQQFQAQMIVLITGTPVQNNMQVGHTAIIIYSSYWACVLHVRLRQSACAYYSVVDLCYV
eukprot:GHVS01090583.1.p1 GENE.GHVS01090583.1~~GHVS01090583.1.p1  ORF type:complete len:267 (-),score=33.63 GHVS01090583.1:68-868(-)